MSDNISSSKRIAKNTIFLYVRMLFLLAISLFTSRVILDALGVVDYGIYSVVGGIVALFAILSQSLSNAVGRFLNFELGKGDESKLLRVFSCSVTILTLLAILVAIITEVVGLWYLNNKMVIPEDRLYASNWVFHFSVIAFCINLISAPYNAAIIAHEKMSTFAYISIFEGVAKLAIAYIIMYTSMDRLVLYALMILLVQLIVRLIYGWYCKKYFLECHYQIILDRPLLKEIISYAGWTFIGNAANTIRTQGGNMVINIFAGPVVNAARGIAMQVDSAVAGFANNFFVAVNPQITQSYARGDQDYLMKLIFNSSRLSYYLMLMIGLPIIVNADFLMQIWLKEVPDHAPQFVVLVLISTILNTLSGPLITANTATGRVRNYQLVVGGIILLNVPLSYLALSNGFAPEIVLVISILLDCFCLIARVVFLRYNIELNIKFFLREVILSTGLVTLVSVIPIYVVSIHLSPGIKSFFLSCVLCVLWTLSVILIIGIKKEEKNIVFKYIKSKIANEK